MAHTCGGDPGDQRDSEFQGILTPNVDPCRKGSKEGMARNEVLHHQGRGGLDSQILACPVDTANIKTNNKTNHDTIFYA